MTFNLAGTFYSGSIVTLSPCRFSAPCQYGLTLGMTTYCYFLQIIIYNLVTIYGIATKFGIRMHPYPDFQCTKFQGNQIMPLCVIATFTP